MNTTTRKALDLKKGDYIWVTYDGEWLNVEVIDLYFTVTTRGPRFVAVTNHIDPQAENIYFEFDELVEI